MRSNFAVALCSALALVACSSSSTPDAALATIDAPAHAIDAEHAGIDAAHAAIDATVSTAVNGCTAATATDMTSASTVTIGFGGTSGSSYYTFSPACVKVAVGTVITVAGAFADHPFEGGTVVGTTVTVATTGPFVGLISTGTTKNYTMTDAGTFGFLCEYHAASNQMYGAVIVQ